MNDPAIIYEVDRDAPAPSPFLPGTNIQIAWDSTCLGMLKQCPRLYQYVMIDGWGSNEENIHLFFGREYHSALEEYDKLRVTGVSHDEAIHGVVRELLIRTYSWKVDPETKAGKYKNRASLVMMVVDYLDKYQHDPAKTFVLKDGRPAVELSFRFELDWGPKAALPFAQTTPKAVMECEPQPYLLSGHLDRVVDFGGSLFVMDRKTTTTTPGPYFFNGFAPNNQMTLYTLASQVILDSPVKGVIIDAAQILIGHSAFVRDFTYRTPDQLDEWTHDLRYWLSMAESFAENNYWPMNDTACSMYGGCRFREVCSKSPQVRDKFLAGKFTKLEPSQRWNPLAVR